MKTTSAKRYAFLHAPIRAIAVAAFFTAFCAFTTFGAPGISGVLGTAHADVFYASSKYETGSAGVIKKDGGSFSVNRDVTSNFGQDAWGFTFKDPNGTERAMIREYNYGPNDTVYVWDPANFKATPLNVKTWGSNIHAVASDGQYLYLATYESYAGASGPQDTGEIVRVDMRGDAYRRDKAYHYERHVENNHTVSPHAEDIHIEGDKIYVLYGMPYNGVTQYEPRSLCTRIAMP
jgi:hypothetical protein